MLHQARICGHCWTFKNLTGNDLEAAILNIFKVAGALLEKHDFHAIHRLCNIRVVIAKVGNHRDVIAILHNKKKFHELSQEGKKNSRVKKLMSMNLWVPPTILYITYTMCQSGHLNSARYIYGIYFHLSVQCSVFVIQ